MNNTHSQLSNTAVPEYKDYDIPAAFRALRDLLKADGNPEPGARFAMAMGMRKWYRILTEKVRHQPHGASILKERFSMGELLNNWESLRQLPEGSVGRAYLAWAEREQLTVKGLEEAVAPAMEPMPTEEQDYIRNRSRDLHDLFHVLTGYGRDGGGETALLNFTYAQHGNKTMRMLSWIGLVFALLKGRFDIVRLRSVARKRGAQAKVLIAQPWQTLMSQPIDEVRQDMGLLPLPQYKPFRP